MRRSSHRLRDLALTAVVAVSLVLIPEARPARADYSCYPQWGTFGGSAARIGINFSLTLQSWTFGIAPTGSMPRGLGTPGRPWTVIGSGSGRGGTFTWDATRFANGMYDVVGEYRVSGSQTGAWWDYCSLRILNLPTAPSPVTISPFQNSVDVFDASWGASSVPGGLAYYEYYADCNTARILTTSAQGARLTGQAVTYGTHYLCVRAVSRSGDRGPYAYGYFSYQPPSSRMTQLTFPSPVLAGTTLPVSAVLTDGSGRPLPGRTVDFFAEWSGSLRQGVTDASGRARATLPVTSTPRTYYVVASFRTDGTYTNSGTTGNVVVIRDTTPPSVPTGVFVTPATTTVNLFDAGWSYSSDASGVAYYEWRIDGGALRVAGGVRLYRLTVGSVGRHSFEVRAVDTQGNRSAFASTTFELRAPAPTLTFTQVPASVARCSPVDVAARLTSGGAPLAGRAIALRVGGTGATAVTDAQGIASASVPFEGAPGQYTISATFTGDTTMPAAQATATVQVTGDPSQPCTPTGGGPPGGGPPGGGPPGGGPPGGGQPGGGASGGGQTQGGLSVDIPPAVR